MHVKPWEEKLAIIDERRSAVTSRAPKGKGPPPQRKCPEDFDVIFVEIGRVDCESWYRAGRVTIDRWLDERGKKRLIRMRAQFVRHQRHTAAAKPVLIRSKPARDRRKVSFMLARHAAQFLRIVRHGGMIVSPTADGDWWVGSKRLTAGQMLDLAVSRGFEPRTLNLQEQAEKRVGHSYGHEAQATGKPPKIHGSRA